MSGVGEMRQWVPTIEEQWKRIWVLTICKMILQRENIVLPPVADASFYSENVFIFNEKVTRAMKKVLRTLSFEDVYSNFSKQMDSEGFIERMGMTDDDIQWCIRCMRNDHDIFQDILTFGTQTVFPYELRGFSHKEIDDVFAVKRDGLQEFNGIDVVPNFPKSKV